MERLDESIVWDQYATYVATDGSFLARSQTQLFRSFLRRVTMAPRKLSAATLRAARAVSDPCKENRIQVSGVDTLVQRIGIFIGRSLFAPWSRAPFEKRCRG